MFYRATLTVAAVAILATGGLAFAQSSSSSSSAPAAGSASSDDQQFITNAIEGDNSEMALGGLAMGRGSTVAVRDFGYTLVTDHRKAKVGAEDLASKYNVQVPTDLTPEAQAELQKLIGLTGTDFDQEFASYMVQDHTKDISDFKDEAKKKGDVGSYAEKTLPTLEKHLKIAQSLQTGGASSGAPDGQSSASEMSGGASDLSGSGGTTSSDSSSSAVMPAAPSSSSAM